VDPRAFNRVGVFLKNVLDPLVVKQAGAVDEIVETADG
jgi:hypothetical protein